MQSLSPPPGQPLVVPRNDEEYERNISGISAEYERNTSGTQAIITAYVGHACRDTTPTGGPFPPTAQLRPGRRTPLTRPILRLPYRRDEEANACVHRLLALVPRVSGAGGRRQPLSRRPKWSDARRAEAFPGVPGVCLSPGMVVQLPRRALLPASERRASQAVRKNDCHAFILQQLRQVNAGAGNIAFGFTRRRII